METLTKDVSSEQTFKLSNRLDLMVAPHSFLCRNGWGTKTGARQWSITIVDSAGRSERGAAVRRCLSMLYSVVTLNIQIQQQSTKSHAWVLGLYEVVCMYVSYECTEVE